MPSIVALYHYFHPDDVVSAIHYSELCAGLQKLGWDVTVLPCNRGCRDELRSYPARSDWRDIKIHRIWRPRIPQSNSLGRIVNMVWMLIAWSLAALRYKPDILLVGTDPILSVLVAIPWKIVRPSIKVAHWCFDLYPEAAFADGLLDSSTRISRLIKWLTKAAYARCDLLVDIGSCMGAHLMRDRPDGPRATLTPWALLEPSRPFSIDVTERKVAFPNARLTMLYSGSFGRAHAFERTLSLARRLRDSNVVLAFSVRGNAVTELRAAVTSADYNIGFRSFLSQDRLAARLSAADIHVVTLRDAWTGTVVPSKFFAALAVGRPVLFEGSPMSAIAIWIREFRVGWVLTADSEESIAEELVALSSDPRRLADLFDHCHAIYTSKFSKQLMIDAWNRELRVLCSFREETASSTSQTENKVAHV